MITNDVAVMAIAAMAIVTVVVVAFCVYVMNNTFELLRHSDNEVESIVSSNRKPRGVNKDA